MRALAAFAEHYGVPDLGMSWWLFLALVHRVSAIEARALLRAIDGPAIALNRLSEEGQMHFTWTRDRLEAMT